MLASYRSAISTNTKVARSEQKKDPKGPILPEVSQIVVNNKTGNRYFRGRLLGKGGFARCYEVSDMETERRYACKAIAKARISKPHQKAKIANEVELHKNLTGEFIVGFNEYFEDSENIYMLLELCSRKSMVQLLKQRRTLTEPEVRYFIHQTVQGVIYLHDQHVIHRDIKLGNLFINNDMQIRIGDFGLAVRALSDGRKETSVCGTPNYIAPEVLSKVGHSYEVDTWAIGCVMYTLLVGRPPFETSCLKDTYMRIRNNEYAIPARVSRVASKLIQRLLSEEPGDRPSLQSVLNDDFFTRGYLPTSLPSVCCVAPPKFSNVKNKKKNTKRSHVDRSEKSSQEDVSSLSTVKDALDRISLNTRSEEFTESGIESQCSQVEDDEDAGIQADDAILEEDSEMNYHNPQKLYSRLNACLESMPSRNSVNDNHTNKSLGTDSDEDQSSGYNSHHGSGGDSNSRIWITKWVDYSNKYGFGAQLSNGSIVIRYNDGTTLAVDNRKRRLQYFDEDRNIFRFSVNNIPDDLSRKVTLLNYFSNYMDKHLLKGGDLDEGDNHEVFTEISIIDIWFRTDKAMVMYLSDGTLQVNFLADHTKLILNPEEYMDVVTYINEDRESFVMTLDGITKKGCQDSVSQRLQYCLMVLHKLTDMYLDEES